MQIRFTAPLKERKPTEYKIWPLENGCIKILYYKGWVRYTIMGIPFWFWDNVFLPTLDGTSTIQQSNTDLDAFQKQWPYAEDYFTFLNGAAGSTSCQTSVAHS